MHAVTVQYYKYPRTRHWRHEMRYLGRDDHGTWLGAPVGSMIQKGDEPPKAFDRPFVQLVPHNAHWSAIFNGPTAVKYEVYVDVATPACWTSDTHVEMLDVDLDVVRTIGGTIEVLDEDEFREHSHILAYPAHLISRARATTAEIVLALERGNEPFATAWRPWWYALEKLA